MSRTITGRTAAVLLAFATVACGAARSSDHAGVAPAAPPAATNSRHQPYTAADVQFMSDMILHHAQAVLIAGWAPSHGASRPVRALCERIVVGQQDEIALMERWLRARGETVPTPDSSHHTGPSHGHSGAAHAAAMPGMLTAEQLAQLNRARGPEFDRLFLTFMIVHHQGALTMVDRLFSTPGAAQDETVFRMASDIHAEQTTEIARMRKLLVELPPPHSAPS